jgi:hypothetical protein
MLNRILYALRLKKRPDPNLNKDDVLKSIPVRNSVIKWELDQNDEASLVIPQKDKLWVKLASKIFMLPDKRVVALDEVGSFVWTQCDGNNTIDMIVRKLRNKYNLTRKEAETSLLMYMRQLGKRGYVGFAVPRERAQRIVAKKKSFSST